MPKKLQNKLLQIERQINTITEDNVRFYHKLGVVVLDVKQRPTEYVGLDGTSGMTLLKAALSTKDRLLRAAAKFAELYDSEQLNALLALKHPELEHRITWGHIIYLLSVDDVKERERLAKQAVSELLDGPALHRRIKRAKGRTEGHGRKHEMPKTVLAQITQVDKLTSQWLAKHEHVWVIPDKENSEFKTNVFENYLNMPVEELTPEMLDVLKSAAASLPLIAERAAEMNELVGRCIEHSEEVLRQREAATSAKATPVSGNHRQIDLQSPPPVTRSKRRGAA